MNKYLISGLLLNSALVAATHILDVSIPDIIALPGCLLAIVLMLIGIVKSKK